MSNACDILLKATCFRWASLFNGKKLEEKSPPPPSKESIFFQNLRPRHTKKDVSLFMAYCVVKFYRLPTTPQQTALDVSRPLSLKTMLEAVWTKNDNNPCEFPNCRICKHMSNIVLVSLSSEGYSVSDCFTEVSPAVSEPFAISPPFLNELSFIVAL